jgi:carbon-monoxide dehydrogenase large subunit
MKFGQAVRRKEDQRFLTGAGRYVSDINLANQAHLHILRSPHAHARLRGIDVAAARAAPGVLEIVTGDELAAAGLGTLPCLVALTNVDGTTSASPPYPLLASGRVRHVGEGVAAIVAQTPEQARDAADLILCDYEALPATVDTAGALDPAAPQVWDDVPGNLCFHWEAGDRKATDAAFARAAHVTRIAVVNNRVVVNAMEPRGSVGSYDRGTRRYTLHTVNQGPHMHRSVIAGILGIPENELRIVTPDVGGGFGMKAIVYADQVLTLWLSRRVGRPVKWVSERAEAFLCDTQGRDNVTEVELALDHDARFLGLRVSTVANLGAYLSTLAPAVPTGGTAMLAGLYRTPAIHAAIKGVFTHTVPVDAYRGAGRPEASYALERVVDTAARELGLDAAEIRRRNLIPSDAMPYTSPLSVVYDGGAFLENLAEATRAADWDGFAGRRQEAAARGRLRGLGLANYVEVTGWVPGDTTRIRFDPSGTVTLIVGSVSNGQGHETSYAQLLAEKLGVAFDSVRVIEGDTDSIAEMSSGNGGSHFLQIGGPSLLGAADKIIARGKLIAAHLLEASDRDIEFAAGVFRVAGTDRTRTIVEVAKAALNPEALPPSLEPGLDESFFYRRESNAYPNGCHICEVEIDPETGAVEVVRYTAVDDFGRILNPLLVAGQVQGGVAQGIGQALLERTVYEPATGQLLTGSFMDYAMPRAENLPAIEVSFNEVPCRTNPLGVKGCGEAGAVGACPAVINAVVDALAPLGVRSIDMPATPERVWRAIAAARAAPAPQVL